MLVIVLDLTVLQLEVYSIYTTTLHHTNIWFIFKLWYACSVHCWIQSTGRSKRDRMKYGYERRWCVGVGWRDIIERNKLIVSKSRRKEMKRKEWNGENKYKMKWNKMLKWNGIIIIKLKVNISNPNVTSYLHNQFIINLSKLHILYLYPIPYHWRLAYLLLMRPWR